MWQDIAVAWRFLLKRPIATAIAVMTLGVTGRAGRNRHTHIITPV